MSTGYEQELPDGDMRAPPDCHNDEEDGPDGSLPLRWRPALPPRRGTDALLRTVRQ